MTASFAPSIPFSHHCHHHCHIIPPLLPGSPLLAQTQEDDEEEVKERLQLAADDFASMSQQTFGKCAVEYDNESIERPSPILFSAKAKPALTAAERRKSLQSEIGVCSTVKGDEKTSSCEFWRWWGFKGGLRRGMDRGAFPRAIKNHALVLDNLCMPNCSDETSVISFIDR